jgi:hypothetical protein
MSQEAKVWYSYKCRAENFIDIANLYIKIYDYVEYEDVRILNTIIVNKKDAFVWEFDSDRTLEELVDMCKRINYEHKLDIQKLYETINYRGVYNDEVIR